MPSPFDQDDARYQVLANAGGQHSLWPALWPVPSGWRVVHAGDTREACARYIETHRRDLRPRGGPEPGQRPRGRSGQGERLIDLFEAMVRRTPWATALEHGPTVLTYAELNVRANRLAHHLIALGLGPERLAAIVMPRGDHQIVALLAVLKSGAAYLPIDVSNPAERVRFMLDDAAPTCVISTRAAAAGQPIGGRPLLLDDPATVALVAGHPGSNPRLGGRARPGDPAYVIYTSGSTGRPKGVVVTHLGIPDLARSTVETLELDADSRVLQVASPGFDAAVLELLMAFAPGGTLVVPAAGLMAGDALEAVLREGRISHALIGPAVLAGLDPAAVGLRCLVVGGEACPEPLAARWSAGRRMINAYGPTEITVLVTYSDPLRGQGPPPIGRPIRGARVLVLDERLRPVPPRHTGEVYVAGPGLARGYLGRPALTAERFVADPFGPPGSRLYRTGDLARWNDEGELEFRGRSDDQVKLRGFRIELGEVESALLACPGVRQAAVALRRGANGSDGLVAYVVPSDQPARRPRGGMVAELRARLAAALPDHMVPSAFVFMDRLPLTSSGKLDRSALPEPDPAVAAGPGRAARNPREQQLCDLFADVLGVRRVGVEDNFFEIGGNSLTAAKLVGRLRTEAGMPVTAAAFFAKPTVAGLAETMRDEGGEARP